MSRAIRAAQVLRIAFVFCISILMLSNSAPSVHCQALPSIDNAKGLSPMASYDVGEIDNVNPITGNVFLNIPLLSYPQRGRNLRLTFRIYYNDKTWFLMNYPVTPGGGFQPPPFWTWMNNNAAPTSATTLGVYVARDQYLDMGWDHSISYSSGGSSGYSQYTFKTDLISQFVRETNGAKHYYGDIQYESCTANSGGCQPYIGYASNTYPANDSSGYSPGPGVNGYEIVMQGPDGVNYLIPAGSNGTYETVTDLNGNSISANATGWTDSLGRQIPGSASGPGTATGFIDPTNTNLFSTEPIPGVPNGGNSRTWTVPSMSGGNQQFTFNYSNVNFQTSFSKDFPPITSGRYGAVPEASGTSNMLTQIVLPNGNDYEFTYDFYLSLKSLKLPTGALISYEWQNVLPLDPGNLSMPFSRALKTRTIDPGNGQPVRIWTYQWIPTSGSNVYLSIVTDPALNDTERTLTASGVTILKAYQGKSPNSKLQITGQVQGTLLKEEDYTLESSRGNAARTPIASQAVSTQTAVIGVDTYIHSANGILHSKVAKLQSDAQSCIVAGIPTGLGQTSVPNYTVPTCFRYNSIKETDEYDFGINSVGPLLKTTKNTYMYETTPAYMQAALMTLPDTISVIDPTSAAQVTVTQTQYHYDEAGSPVGVHGNLTSVTTGVGSDQVKTSTQFNAQGMPVSSTDASGNSTAYNYDTTGLFLSSIVRPQTNGISHTDRYSFDAMTGKIKSHTDENQQTTNYSYINSNTGALDSLNRLQKITYPSTTSGSGYTHLTYNDTPGSLSVTSSEPQDSRGTLKKATTYFDGMGDTIRTTLDSDPQGAVYTDTTYDAMGRVSCVSNPYRMSSGNVSQYGAIGFLLLQTCTAYDGLGRPSALNRQDWAAQTWTYSGNVTTFTDEAKRSWQQTTDALGRLSNVVEPGNLNTAYQYDALGDLTGVLQSGLPGEVQRAHSFTYNSLSHLLTSANPETGKICYGLWQNSSCVGGYDLNGNLLYKTDARGVVTSYTYDALNRLTYKHYSDGTLLAAYGYDGNIENGAPVSVVGATSANAIGRLSTVSNQTNAATAFSYDAMGRVVLQESIFQDEPLWSTRAGAAYDLAGNMTSLVYPDGRNLTQTFDGAGRLIASGDHGATQNYLQSILYNPDGSPGTTTLGNGIVQNVLQNNRLQVAGLTVRDPLAGTGGTTYLNHTYCYSIADCPNGGSANNGNIWQITDTRNPARTQAFTYDSLNRIQSFSLGGVLSQQYTIDSFGNMSPLVASSIGQPNPTLIAQNQFDASNRIGNLPCAASVAPYDAGGNQLCDTDPNGALRSYSYDAENRIASIAVQGGTPFETYTYGADGSRVRKTNADGTFTEYVNFAGQTIAERDQTGAWTDYIFAGGKKIAIAPLQENVLQVAGSYSGNWTGVGLSIAAPALQSYTFQAGDVLNVRQRKYGYNVHGGILIYGKDNSGNTIGSYFNDQDGQRADDDTLGSGTWHNRRIPLDGLAGTIYSGISFGGGTSTDYNFQFGSITVSSADGTVRTIYNGGTNGPYTSVASDGNATRFYVADHLGSAQMEFSAVGQPLATTQFAPFGAEISPATSINHYKFSGKERDAESGLDYFGARYYANSMGRWMSPDPKAPSKKTLMNPQKWNKYAYVLNNPLSLVDPDGMEEMTIVYRTFIAPPTLTFLGRTYAGDSRTFSNAPFASSRSTITVRIETDPSIRPGNPIISQTSSAGQSRTLDANGNTTASATQTQGLPTATGTRDANGDAVIGITQDVKNPLSPALGVLTPGISANLSMNFTPDGSSVTTTGTASNFPSQELNVSGADGTTTPVFQFTPPAGSNPFSLYTQDRKVNCTTTGTGSSCQ